MAGVDRPEQIGHVLRRHLPGLALDDAVPIGANPAGRIEDDDVAVDQHVEQVPDGRQVYFADWMRQAPAGLVKDNRKFIYNPRDRKLWVYDLSTDPLESDRMELAEQQSRAIADEIIAWRKGSIFRLDQERTGERMLFNRWLCSWTDRVCRVKYQKAN